jgi:hypothetical protein
MPFAPPLLKLLGCPLEKVLYFIEKTGDVVQVSIPRLRA